MSENTVTISLNEYNTLKNKVDALSHLRDAFEVDKIRPIIYMKYNGQADYYNVVTRDQALYEITQDNKELAERIAVLEKEVARLTTPKKKWYLLGF
jgi:hypothetical protein